MEKKNVLVNSFNTLEVGTSFALKPFQEFWYFCKGLRYLNFHHVDTKLFPAAAGRVADAEIGLQEVSDMKELIRVLDIVGEKEWFKRKMGMTQGGFLSQSAGARLVSYLNNNGPGT